LYCLQTAAGNERIALTNIYLNGREFTERKKYPRMRIIIATDQLGKKGGG
jgi:hypothetical protein